MILLRRPAHKGNLFTRFLQLLRAPQAHINILANQKTIVAHQALTYWTQIEKLDSFFHCFGKGPALLPLIQQIEDDPLGFGLGVFVCLGKADRCTLPYLSTLRANQVENKFFLIGAIYQALSDMRQRFQG